MEGPFTISMIVKQQRRQQPAISIAAFLIFYFPSCAPRIISSMMYFAR